MFSLYFPSANICKQLLYTREIKWQPQVLVLPFIHEDTAVSVQNVKPLHRNFAHAILAIHAKRWYTHVVHCSIFNEINDSLITVLCAGLRKGDGLKIAGCKCEQTVMVYSFIQLLDSLFCTCTTETIYTGKDDSDYTFDSKLKKIIKDEGALVELVDVLRNQRITSMY